MQYNGGGRLQKEFGADVYKNSFYSSGFKRPATDLILTHYQSITKSLLIHHQSTIQPVRGTQAATVTPRSTPKQGRHPTNDQQIFKSMFLRRCSEIETVDEVSNSKEGTLRHLMRSQVPRAPPNKGGTTQMIKK